MANSEPRRVALFYDGRGYGGAEAHLELLLRHLDRTRYDPQVVIPGRLWKQLAPELLDTFRVNATPVHVTPELAPGSAVRRFVQYVRMLRSLNCDLAYVGTSTAIGLRKDVLALRLAGMPVVRLLHMPPSSMKTFHQGHRSPRSVRLLDRLVALDLTVSAVDREELIREFGIPAHKVEVCHHGLELERFVPRRSPQEARRALQLEVDVPAVGLVGRFVQEKGHRFLVEAAPAILQQFGPVQFVMVGSGNTEDEIKALIAEKGLTRSFVLAGFQRDVRPWIEALDLVVVPSLFESAGLALLECMAMERPAVASDLPTIREHVGGEACTLVPVGDSAAISRAVIDLLRNPELRTELGDRGARLVRERFDARRHVTQIMEVLDRMGR
jgi:glycosyltransferase involved in cell wall biosynthesis